MTVRIEPYVRSFITLYRIVDNDTNYTIASTFWTYRAAELYALEHMYIIVEN